MANKLALSIIVSIILTVIIIALVNVGIAVFMDAPQWENYCNIQTQEIPTNQSRCEALNGTWNAEGKTAPRNPAEPEYIEGYCNLIYPCQQDYDKAMKNYNQIRFYIVAIIGFILLLTGLFATENIIQLTGLATGGILVGEGVVLNFKNEIVVFATLLAILIIFGIVAWRVIRRR